MKNFYAIVFSVILLAARGAAAQTCAFTTEFEATLLPGVQGDFGVAETEGTDINEAGDAVGSAFVEQPVLAWRGVRWPVGAPEPQILTDGMGRVNGLSDNRLAAGEDEAGGSLWDADNVRTLLPGLTGHLGAVATDVNSNGII